MTSYKTTDRAAGGVLRQRAAKVTEAVALGSTELSMEASTKADPDEVFEREPVTRSHKLWRMGETNLGSPTMNQVMMEATQAATKVTGQIRDLSTTRHVDRPPTNQKGGDKDIQH